MADYDLGRATGEIVIGTDSARRNVDGLTKSLNSSISKAGQQMARTGTRLSLGVTLPLVGVATAAVKTSIEFQKTMNTMSAVAGVPGPELEKLRALAIQLGADTVFSANEAGEGMLELGKAGVSTADIMGGALKNTLALATAGDLALADAATITSNAMNVFSIKGKDSQQVADALAGAANASSADVSDLAQALTQGGNAAALAGQSIQGTTGFLAALADQGIRGSDAGTSLKTFLLSLVPTSQTAKDAIKNLNLEFINQDGTIKSISEVADQLHDKLGGLTQAQQQTALKTIFGTDAFRAASTAMKLGSDGLAEYIDATSKAGSASEVAAGKMKGLPGVIETLKGSIDTALLSIGDVLTPIVTVVANSITTLANAFVALPQPIKVGIVAILALVAAAGPLLFIIGSAATLFSIILGPIGLVVAAIAALVFVFVRANGGIEGTLKVLGRFFSALQEQFGPALQSLAASAGEVFSFFSSNIPGAMAAVTAALQPFITALAVDIPKAIDTISAFLRPFIEILGHELARTWAILVDVWNTQLKPALADLGVAFSDIWPAVKVVAAIIGGALFVSLILAVRMIGILAQAIGQIIRVFAFFTRIIATVSKFVFGNLVRSIEGNINTFRAWIAFISSIPHIVGAYFQQLYVSIRDWIVRAALFITDKFNGIVNFFRGLGGKLAAAGRNMWNWLVSGVKGVANTAIGILNSIIGRINSFQIHIHVDPPGPGAVDFDWNGPGIPTIPGLAQGIRHFRGGLAIVGEAGPELVELPRGSDVLPNRILRSLEKGDAFRTPRNTTTLPPQSSLRGVEVVGTVETPFGPAEIRGMIRDEIEDNDKFSRTLHRMGNRR